MKNLDYLEKTFTLKVTGSELYEIAHGLFLSGQDYRNTNCPYLCKQAHILREKVINKIDTITK